MAKDEKPEQKSVVDHIFDGLKGKIPGWAVFLVILFGSGGIVYTGYDYYLKHREVKTYDGGLTLPDVEMSASFFPHFETALQSSFVVNAKNISLNRSVPNLKISIDTGSARIAQCELRSSTRGATLDKLGTGIYSLTLPRLGPKDVAAVYCVGEAIGTVEVKLAAKEDLGTDIGSNEFAFSRGRLADTADSSSSSGFKDFLYVLLGIFLVILMGCMLSILFGLMGKIYRRWKFFEYKDT
jgi:hypothetical protein